MASGVRPKSPSIVPVLNSSAADMMDLPGSRPVLMSLLVMLTVAAGPGAAWAAGAEASDDTLRALGATLERPLFAHNRRRPPSPDVAPAPVESAPPIVPPQLAISGIIRGGSKEIALVRKADGSRTSLILGSQIDGWVVTRIEDRSIRLERDSQAIDLSLPDHGGATLR